MAPLVVALHGCSQSAEDYDRGAGWSALADRLGFAVRLSRAAAGQQSEELFLLVLAGRHHARPRRGALDPADGRARHCDFRHRPAAGVRDRPLGRRRHGFGHAGDISRGFCRRRHYCRTSLWLRAVRATGIRRHVHGAIDVRARARRSRASGFEPSRAMAENIGLARHRRSDREASNGEEHRSAVDRCPRSCGRSLL